MAKNRLEINQIKIQWNQQLLAECQSIFYYNISHLLKYKAPKKPNPHEQSISPEDISV